MMNLTEATILALQNAKKVTESEKIVNQGYCPKCNAPLTGYYDEAQWYSGYIGYPFQCPRCGTKGEERCEIVYKETFITEEPINDSWDTIPSLKAIGRDMTKATSYEELSQLAEKIKDDKLRDDIKNLINKYEQSNTNIKYGSSDISKLLTNAIIHMAQDRNLTD